MENAPTEQRHCFDLALGTTGSSLCQARRLVQRLLQIRREHDASTITDGLWIDPDSGILSRYTSVHFVSITQSSVGSQTRTVGLSLSPDFFHCLSY